MRLSIHETYFQLLCICIYLNDPLTTPSGTWEGDVITDCEVCSCHLGIHVFFIAKWTVVHPLRTHIVHVVD